ncbi:MAG: hypothetical protein JW983_06670 [Elusimicrobia bacterium]|nr:hypothetical protein [Elusimicrobiota bacterium]
MEKVQVNKAEVMENYTLIWHKIMVICMLIALLWSVISAVSGIKPQLGFFGAILFIFPSVIARFTPQGKGIRNLSSWWSWFIHNIGILLFIVITTSLLIILGQNILAFCVIILFMGLNIYLRLKYYKKYRDTNLLDERLIDIDKKARMIALTSFLLLTVIIFIAFSYGLIQMANLGHLRVIMMLIFLNILYFIFIIRSMTFLYLYYVN